MAVILATPDSVYKAVEKELNRQFAHNLPFLRQEEIITLITAVKHGIYKAFGQES